jgi:biopolymer transport protein ExbB
MGYSLRGKQTMNPTTFGLPHLWAQGDAITRAVAVLLLLMSLTSWVVILIKSVDLVRHKAQAQRVEGFWHSTDFADALNQLGNSAGNPYTALALEGRSAAVHILHQDGVAKPQLHDSLNLSDWLTRSLRNSIDDAHSRLQSGLAVLASVGSTAPFVGLFGTVWGIYHALLSIGSAGQATIDKIAGPVGEALVMTALGLAVAIPAVLGYNALLRGNKGVQAKLGRFAHDLHAYFVTGARVPSSAHNAVLVNVTPLKKA